MILHLYSDLEVLFFMILSINFSNSFLYFCSTALEKFGQCVSDGSYDLIANYAKSSPEAAEVMGLLENQNNSFGRRKPEEVRWIFILSIEM